VCKFVEIFKLVAHYPIYKSVKKTNFVILLLIAENEDGAKGLHSGQ
jgi:hypothetical protein